MSTDAEESGDLGFANAMRNREWETAEAIAHKLLELDTSSHWNWTVLAEALNEQGRHDEALAASDKAGSISPSCPLVVWDRGCILRNMSRYGEALSVFETIASQGLPALMADPCAESPEWVIDLYNDTVYQAASIALRLGDCAKALKYVNILIDASESGSRCGVPRDKIAMLAANIIRAHVD